MAMFVKTNGFTADGDKTIIYTHLNPKNRNLTLTIDADVFKNAYINGYFIGKINEDDFHVYSLNSSRNRYSKVMSLLDFIMDEKGLTSKDIRFLNGQTNDYTRENLQVYKSPLREALTSNNDNFKEELKPEVVVENNDLETDSFEKIKSELEALLAPYKQVLRDARPYSGVCEQHLKPGVKIFVTKGIIVSRQARTSSIYFSKMDGKIKDGISIPYYDESDKLNVLLHQNIQSVINYFINSPSKLPLLNFLLGNGIIKRKYRRNSFLGEAKVFFENNEYFVRIKNELRINDRLMDLIINREVYDMLVDFFGHNFSFTVYTQRPSELTPSAIRVNIFASGISLFRSKHPNDIHINRKFDDGCVYISLSSLIVKGSDLIYQLMKSEPGSYQKRTNVKFVVEPDIENDDAIIMTKSNIRHLNDTSKKLFVDTVTSDNEAHYKEDELELSTQLSDNSLSEIPLSQSLPVNISDSTPLSENRIYEDPFKRTTSIPLGIEIEFNPEDGSYMLFSYIKEGIKFKKVGRIANTFEDITLQAVYLQGLIDGMKGAL